MRSFEDLDCWKKVTALRSKLDETVKVFPKEERYRLMDQIIRAARSSTSNIAEGYGRFHYQENVQYCRQARGSLFELIDHLIIANDADFISSEELANLKHEIEFCLTVLNGYINYLLKAKTDSLREPEEFYDD